MKYIFVSVRAGLAALTAAALLAGCGLAETGATAAAEAKAAAEQAKQGKELQEKMERDIAAAQQKQADALQKADEATGQ